MGDDHPDQSYRGTGAEFARLDFGAFGDLVFEDDGDDDKHVRYYFENSPSAPNETHTMASALINARRKHGDAWVVEAFDDIAAGEVDDSSSTAWDRHGPPAFKCAGCNLTWPRTKNQTPGPGDDHCPNCAPATD